VGNLLDRFSWIETSQATSLPPEELLDVTDGEGVLFFTYCYLQTRSLPPSDSEVHNVTAAIAQYQGSQIVRWSTLEL
jgi:hypothetical protein